MYTISTVSYICNVQIRNNIHIICNIFCIHINNIRIIFTISTFSFTDRGTLGIFFLTDTYLLSSYRYKGIRRYSLFL